MMEKVSGYINPNMRPRAVWAGRDERTRHATYKTSRRGRERAKAKRGVTAVEPSWELLMFSPAAHDRSLSPYNPALVDWSLS